MRLEGKHCCVTEAGGIPPLGVDAILLARHDRVAEVAEKVEVPHPALVMTALIGMLDFSWRTHNAAVLKDKRAGSLFSASRRTSGSGIPGQIVSAR